MLVDVKLFFTKNVKYFIFLRSVKAEVTAGRGNAREAA